MLGHQDPLQVMDCDGGNGRLNGRENQQGSYRPPPPRLKNINIPFHFRVFINVFLASQHLRLKAGDTFNNLHLHRLNSDKPRATMLRDLRHPPLKLIYMTGICLLSKHDCHTVN